MKSLIALTLALAFFPVQSQAQEKEWTLMVFLNGDNNLDSYGTADMKEMEQIGSSDQVNIVVLRDTSRAKVSSKIYYVEKGKSRVIKDYGSNIDMGDWKNLVEFFRYAKENFPAKKYFVDIWNHGGGWRKILSETDPTRGISYDDNSGNHITTPQLGEAFREMQKMNDGRRIDILGMDACVMQMAEVSYEIKENVDYVAASEDNEPGDGWAYQLFLAELMKKPGMDGAELATIVEREYARSYNGGPQGKETVQGSVVSTRKLEASVESLNRFLSQAISLAKTYSGQFSSAVTRTQKFGEPSFKDLPHFLKQVSQSVNDPGLKPLIDEALASLNETVIANFVTGTTLSNSHGIAIWIPSSSALRAKKTEYAQLSWARDTLWDEFLSALLAP